MVVLETTDLVGLRDLKGIPENWELHTVAS
jgi:hypothetical protein